MRFLITERIRVNEYIDIKYYSVGKHKMTLILELLTVQDDFEDVIHALVAYNKLDTKINTLSFIIFGCGNPLSKNWPLIDMSIQNPDLHLHPSDNTGLSEALEMVFLSNNYFELERTILSYYKSQGANEIMKVVSKNYLNKGEFSMKFLGR